MSVINNHQSWLMQMAKRIRGGIEGRIAPEDICSSLGIGLRCEQHMSSLGALVMNAKREVSILLREAPPYSKRARFTIAHEIAHWLLIRHRGVNIANRDDRDYPSIEILCNRFAGLLLVDTKLIDKNRWGKPREVCLDILKIAALCDVSIEATAREFIYAGLIGAIGLQGRSSTHNAELSWAIASICGFYETRGRPCPDGNISSNMTQWMRVILSKRIDFEQFESDFVGLPRNCYLCCFTQKKALMSDH